MNFLIDSNIFIYASKPDDEKASDFLKSLDSFYYSKITLIEVLGVKSLSKAEEKDLRILFAKGMAIDVSDDVIKKAITCRKNRKMTLGDSIIAATAMLYKIQIATRNVDDFKGIQGLNIHDPYK